MTMLIYSVPTLRATIDGNDVFMTAPLPLIKRLKNSSIFLSVVSTISPLWSCPTLSDRFIKPLLSDKVGQDHRVGSRHQTNFTGVCY